MLVYECFFLQSSQNTVEKKLRSFSFFLLKIHFLLFIPNFCQALLKKFIFYCKYKSFLSSRNMKIFEEAFPLILKNGSFGQIPCKFLTVNQPLIQVIFDVLQLFSESFVKSNENVVIFEEKIPVDTQIVLNDFKSFHR